MPDHDAASIAGQALGMPGSTTPEPLSPLRLVERFTAGEQDEDGHTIARGFCGFDGVQGFDDGYDFLGGLNAFVPAPRPGMQPTTLVLWRALTDKGDWPYHVVVTCSPHGDDERWTIAEYCEGDLTVWRFDTVADARDFAATLKSAP